MSETLYALTAGDTRRMVQSFQRLNILLPGADLERIELAIRTVFDRIWGLNMSDISRMQFAEMRTIGREFSDLLFSMPFQVPQDYLYLVRCVGILAGICTGLDPSFDPWREIQPFARSLLGDFEASLMSISVSPRELLNPKTLRGLLSGESLNLLMDTGWDAAKRAVQLLPLADDVLRRADRGELTVRVTPSQDMERQFRRMEYAIQRLVSAVMFCALIIGSSLLYTAGERTLSYIGFALAMFTFWRVIAAAH
ncbi:MAG TPA: hypothetical protein VHP83_12905 [Aggregatilineaceae bacterium]|nr:hypothetical protein [Aggregatilineaceae bacterium]